MDNETLDCFMAELMGLFSARDVDGTVCYFKRGKWYCDEDGWNPTTDIAQVMECAEKWCDDTGGHYKLEGGIDGSGEFVYRAVLTKWNPRSQSHTRYTGEGTKELAICLALYEAMKGGKK